MKRFWARQGPNRKVGIWVLIIAVFVVAAVLVDMHISEHTDGILNSIADWTLLIVGLPAGVFYVSFLLFSTKWFENPAGRSVAVLGITLVALFAVNCASIFLGLDYPGRAIIRDASYLGISIAVIYLAYTVVHLNAADSIKRLREKAKAEAEAAASDQDSVSA